MKIRSNTRCQFLYVVHKRTAQRQRQRERGVAVIVMLAVLAIILMYVAANARTLHHLGRQVRLIEQQQLQRWSKPVARTNSVPKLTQSVPVTQLGSTR